MEDVFIMDVVKTKRQLDQLNTFPFSGSTYPGRNQKPDNPLKVIRNPIPRNLDNPRKVIQELVPNGILSQRPRGLTVPT